MEKIFSILFFLDNRDRLKIFTVHDSYSDYPQCKFAITD